MPASKRFRILTMAAALVLLAAAPAAAQATYAQVPSPNRPGSNELQGADGADPSLVWAVGRVVDTGGNPSTYRSLILRWNGSAWAQAPHPSFARNHALRGVAAPAADDAWAVGTRQVASGGLVTLVERWDGATWRTVASPNPDPGGLNELNGVAGVPSAPGTVWAVGSHSTPNANFGTRKLILRRTVGGWQVLGSPTFTPEDHLEAVDATAPPAPAAPGVPAALANLTAVITTARQQGTADQAAEALLNQAADVANALEAGRKDNRGHNKDEGKGKGQGAAKELAELQRQMDELIGQGKIRPPATTQIQQAVAQLGQAVQQPG
jgi:hypothetical protein